MIKNYNVSGWFIGCLILLLSFNSWGKNEFKEEFDQFAKGQQESFDHFIQQRDREFLKMLQENWQEFRQMPPLVRDPVPKPKHAPKHDTSRSMEKAAIKISHPDDNKADMKTPEKKQFTQPQESIIFFGNSIQLPKTEVITLRSNNQKGLYDFWKNNARIDHKDLFATLTHFKNSLILSDWAFWLLVKQYSEKYYAHAEASLAFQWYLLNNLGYKVRIAFNDQGLVLLMSTQQTLYEMTYYQIEGERYYHISGDSSGSIKSYRGEFDSKNRVIDMRFNKTLKSIPDTRYRTIYYKNERQQYNLKLPYDYQRVKYFSTYPQLDLKYYFRAPVGDVTENGLRKEIPELLSGNNDKKINQLLHFIHSAFPYAIDEDQFGKENYLLLEEILHYQASDCEDRSVLFAWLARNLLGEKVVGIEYPGHVATAIERNDKLISADPTYIGSSFGEVMPDFQGKEAKTIH